jgi:hypothetical protein
MSLEDKVRTYHRARPLSVCYLLKYDETCPSSFPCFLFAKNVNRAYLYERMTTNLKISPISNSVDTRFMKSRAEPDLEKSPVKPSLTAILAVCAGTCYLMRRLLLKRKRVVTPQQAHMKEMDPNAFGMSANMADGVDFPTAQNDYDRRKKLLITKENDESWDSVARKSATEAELRAQTVLIAIREDERINLFGNIASEDIPLPTTRDMGGQFLTNKDRISQSRVYRMAQRMPKGMHLHLHFNAELQPDILIERAKDNPNMFIRSKQPLLQDKDYAETEIVFSILPPSTTTVNIFTPNYKGEFRAKGSTPWMRWSTFRDEFQKRRGRRAEEWIKEKLILTENDVYDLRQTTNG